MVSLPKQYQNKGLTLGNLINEGNLSLIKAAQRFDETKDFKLTVDSPELLQALAEQKRIVCLPLNRLGSLNKISRSFAELEPSPDEIVKLLVLATFKVVDTLKISGRYISMHASCAQG